MEIKTLNNLDSSQGSDNDLKTPESNKWTPMNNPQNESESESANFETNLKNTTVEKMIDYSKGNQKYQKRIFFGFCLSQMLLGMVAASLIFFFSPVEFNCKGPAGKSFYSFRFKSIN